MLVSELFTRLSYGELSNLSLSGEGSGTIVEDKQPKIIGYANEALLRLYSRFVLKMNDVIIWPIEHITFYRLDSQFAESNENAEEGADLYIHDTPFKPFQDDVIRILSASDINGVPLPLNDADNPNSIYTPQPTVVQLPSPKETLQVALLYQARHVPLTEPTDVIDIPATLEKALSSYIAHLVFSHMNGQEHAAKAAEHLMSYEHICTEIEQKDLVSNSQSNSNTKFAQRGFV